MKRSIFIYLFIEAIFRISIDLICWFVSLVGQTKKLHGLHLAPRSSFAHVCSKKRWKCDRKLAAPTHFLLCSLTLKLLWSQFSRKSSLSTIFVGGKNFDSRVFNSVYAFILSPLLIVLSVSTSVCFFQESAGEDIPIMLLGNKTDKETERQVQQEVGQRLAKVSFRWRKKVSLWQIYEGLFNNFVFILTVIFMGTEYFKFRLRRFKVLLTFSQDCQMIFFECSASSGQNIAESMVHLARWAELKSALESTSKNKEYNSESLFIK